MGNNNPENLSQLCQEAIDAVSACEGNKVKAANLLGISRSTLRDRIAIADRKYSGKIQESENKRDFSNEQKLARIWNAISAYPTNFDMERALGLPIDEIHRQVDKYRTLQIDVPALQSLIWRRTDTGAKISIPPRAREQLERFRIDPEKLKNKNGVVVTAAQFGANINLAFFRSLLEYCRYNRMALAVMPIKYGKIHYDDEGGLTAMFPEELVGHMVFDDIYLCNDEVMLNVTRMRPTLGRFLTSSICEMGGSVSQIFAAPVLELEHRPRLGRNYPKAIMTTGSISYPNYNTDKLGQQDRTGEIAMENHDFAAIVIQPDGDGFHFRQLSADDEGCFYDIDMEIGGARYYTPAGSRHAPFSVDTMVCGDWHTGKTDLTVRDTTFDGPLSMAEWLRPDNICLHDFVDGDSISHYEERQAARRAWKAPKQYDSLQVELDAAVDELKWIDQKTPWAVKYVIASNHPEFVTDYIDTMRWTKDDRNLAVGARLYAVMFGNLEDRNPAKVEARPIDPVVWYLNTHVGGRVKALERTDNLMRPLGHDNAVLLSLHGDQGVKGGRTRSTKEYNALSVPVIVGHNHSAVIWGNVRRVGVSTALRQHYVTSPSTNWTNTHAIVFDNAKIMLLNIINGKWFKKIKHDEQG